MLLKSVPPPVRFYLVSVRWARDRERAVISFSARNSDGMSTATRRNSSKTGNDLESNPDRIRTIRRELSNEYTHNERDNIMESSFKGRDLSEQHDHHRELKEKKKNAFLLIHSLILATLFYCIFILILNVWTLSWYRLIINLATLRLIMNNLY